MPITAHLIPSKWPNMPILKFFSASQRWGNLRPWYVVGSIGALICLVVIMLIPRFESEVSNESGYITRVDLLRLSVEKMPGDEQPFIVASLNNPSKNVARDVAFGFRDEGGVLQFSSSKSTAISPGGDTLQPLQALSIPLAPVSEFLAVFQSKCPGCYFLGIGKEAIMPTEMLPRLCKGALEKGRKCSIEYSVFPISITKQFVTVSGETISGGHPVFVYLSRDTTDDFSVPKN